MFDVSIQEGQNKFLRAEYAGIEFVWVTYEGDLKLAQVVARSFDGSIVTVKISHNGEDFEIDYPVGQTRLHT